MDSLLHKEGKAGIGDFSHGVTPVVFDPADTANRSTQASKYTYRRGNPFPKGYTSSFVSLWKTRRGANVTKPRLWKTH